METEKETNNKKKVNISPAQTHIKVLGLEIKEQLLLTDVRATFSPL